MSKDCLFFTEQTDKLNAIEKELLEIEGEIGKTSSKDTQKTLKHRADFLKTQQKRTKRILAVISKTQSNSKRGQNQPNPQNQSSPQQTNCENDDQQGQSSPQQSNCENDVQQGQSSPQQSNCESGNNQNPQTLLQIIDLKKYFPLNANFFGRTEADQIYLRIKRLRRVQKNIDKINTQLTQISNEGNSPQKNSKIDKLNANLGKLNTQKLHIESSLSSQNVRRAYSNERIKKPKSVLRAVDGVSLSIKRGTTFGIVGESGCGKTTMGRSILRLNEANGGSILFKGVDITKIKQRDLRIMRPQMQIIFQDPYSSLSPRLTVGELIGEAVRAHNIVPKSEHKAYIIDIMKKCGLQKMHYNRYPHEFSGGQRQRICIAKALALKPDFIVCDEPVSALDVSIQAQIINLLKDLQREMGFTYLFISHDLSVIEHISDEIGVMYLGNLVEYGGKRSIYKQPLHPYTKALLSAVPTPDPDIKMKRIMLKGDIPSPANPPEGCKFHTRCSECMEICKEKPPKLADLGGGHFVACHLYEKR